MPNGDSQWWQEAIPYFPTQAVFSDETAQYRVPVEPGEFDEIKIRIRVGRNTATAVYLCTFTNKTPMEQIEVDGLFAYFQGSLPPGRETASYYFLIEWAGGTIYYTKYGAFDEYHPEGWFYIIKNYQTPDWAKGALLYQIYPDRFCDGDPDNNVVSGEYSYLGRFTQKIEDWNALPQEEDIRNFYGGDLQGIIDKMDYFQSLGIEGLYLNPIFVSPSNHKYDIQDYDHVDPHLGKIVCDGEGILTGLGGNQEAEKYKARITNAENLAASDALFASFTREAHKRGMRVMIDGVFNHCGAFHKWLDREDIYGAEGKGAFAYPDSPYHDYFYWNEDGTYESWWGFENHPKLNLEGCPKLEEEILRIGEKWVSAPYHVDGWRLDVAADLGKTSAYNHSFWKKFRARVKGANKDALILAEHYGDAAPWLGGDEWDSIMNYDGFMEPVSWFFTGVSKHSTEHRGDLYNNADVFWGNMSYQLAKIPGQAVATAMNELSNHDHSRFLTRTNGEIGRLAIDGAEAAEDGVRYSVLREAVLFQMTWVGAPTIYYGDEAGLAGWTDPDNRRTYPWGRENKEILDFHRQVIVLRKENAALKDGSLKQLFGEYGMIGYGRFTLENKCVILFNNNEEEKTVSVPVWQIGIGLAGQMKRLILTEDKGFTTEACLIPVVNGHVSLTLPRKSGILLKEVL